MHRHDGLRISIGSAGLNPDAVERVRIVARPALGHIAEHAEIEAVAPAGAGFKQHMREAVAQRLQDIVKAEIIAVKIFALPRAECPPEHIGKLAVHIPLDIFNVAELDHIRDRVDQVLLHVRIRQIQHELVAALRRLVFVCGHRPIRVRAVKVAVRVYHLGLHPQAKLEAHFIDLLCQAADAGGKLLFVDCPVPQRGMIAVALAKPAVV